MKKSLALSAACAVPFLAGCNAADEINPAVSSNNDVICASAPETVSRTFTDGTDIKLSEGMR